MNVNEGMNLRTYKEAIRNLIVANHVLFELMLYVTVNIKKS